MQVDRRAEDDVYALGEGLTGQQLTDPLGGGFVPGLGQHRGIGQQGHRSAADELGPANAGGTVTEHHSVQPDGRFVGQGEHGRPGQQGDLAAEIEVPEGPFDHHVDAHRGFVARVMSARVSQPLGDQLEGLAADSGAIVRLTL